MLFQHNPEELQNLNEQADQLLSDLNTDYPAPIIPTNEQLTAYLVSWMLRQIVMNENRFMGMNAMINVSQTWLITRKAGLS
jgi:hypothetical protein